VYLWRFALLVWRCWSLTIDCLRLWNPTYICLSTAILSTPVCNRFTLTVFVAINVVEDYFRKIYELVNVWLKSDKKYKLCLYNLARHCVQNPAIRHPTQTSSWTLSCTYGVTRQKAKTHPSLNTTHPVVMFSYRH
jgi:hypothetical protein